MDLSQKERKLLLKELKYLETIVTNWSFDIDESFNSIHPDLDLSESYYDDLLSHTNKIFSIVNHEC